MSLAEPLHSRNERPDPQHLNGGGKAKKGFDDKEACRKWIMANGGPRLWSGYRCHCGKWHVAAARRRV